MGNIAYIDLTTREVAVSPISEEMRRLYLGGRGINMYLLYNHIPPGIDAFSPDNVLVFGTGLLTGTAAPSSARFSVSAKSPMTGLLGDSNCGGFWGPELRFAGFDTLVIKGRADRPTYLWICDGHIEFRDASSLWGVDAIETQSRLKKELREPGVQVACIGQAGENLVRFACVRHHYKEAAGRTGMGAVMGSKNLKAIAVKGSGGLEVKHPATLLELRHSLYQAASKRKSFRVMRKYGTPFLLDAHQALGCLPVRNHQRSAAEGEEWMSLSMEKVKAHSLRMVACFGCFVQCRHAYRVPSGAFKGAWAEGPEYYALQCLGARTGTFDLDTMLVAQNLCDRYGMDVGSAGNIIAWAMELYQRGIIGSSQTDGLPLEWGNGPVLLELIARIASRQGFGDILAEDGLRASQKIGSKSEDYFMHVKGMSVCTDERGLKGCALNVATASRGGDHLRSRPIPEGLFLPAEVLERMYGGPVSPDPGSYLGKGRMVSVSEKMLVMPDSLGICKMLTRGLLSPEGMIGYQEDADMVNAVTGLEMTASQMEECGERVVNLERMFNLREGLRREHDTLPKRYFEEETRGGQLSGQKVDRKGFEQMLDEYYALNGWDREGVPRAETLRRLRLDHEPSHLL